ncbi:MAG TPA: hypothetical protein VGF32_28820 [Streptosporangiaceae bacterium]
MELDPAGAEREAALRHGVDLEVSGDVWQAAGSRVNPRAVFG